MGQYSPRPSQARAFNDHGDLDVFGCRGGRTRTADAIEGDGAQAGPKLENDADIGQCAKCMTPRRTKLEDALKVFSKFSEKFLQKPESVLLFSLDTVEHVGYDRCDEPHQTCGHSWAPDPQGSHHGVASGVGRMRSLRGARRGP